MRASFCLSIASLFILSAVAAGAQDAVPWARSIEEAQQIAAQNGRLVLVHFYGDKCPPCNALDANVFPRPEFARALTANYVPVKVNGSRDYRTAMKYGVDRWPVDVILAADGTPLTRPTTSPQDMQQYLGALDQIAAQHKVKRDPHVQLAQGISYDPPASNQAYAQQPQQQPGRDPYAQPGSNLPPRQNADPRYGAVQPQVGAYNPNGYQPSPQQPPQREIDMKSSFQPAVPGQAYVQGTPYRDPRADQNAAPQNAASPGAGLGMPPSQYGQGAPSGYGQQPAVDPRRDVRLSDSGYGAPNGAPVTQPRSQMNPQQQQPPQHPAWQSNPSIAGVGAPPSPAVDNMAGRRPQVEANLPRQALPAQGSNPPLGLEGYCPVSLMEQSKWNKGDVRFGAIHRDRTYLFATQAEQQRFLANPDKYSPMLSGYDPIKYLEQGTLVDGKRKHGIMHQDGHMYLFEDEASLEKFCALPPERQQQIAGAVRQAMQQSVAPNMRR